ncbi:UDP-N-acetylmuramyl pentapeptide phosphotransferase [Desulfobacula sp.]|uniref:UDP-N-acetylmuramyl pentapeptide phosphotransferase n=1 Tax=Desulfobacula sp. TaxID=2593537 RepID=UPI0039B98F1A|nr:UDP-N-acetylmuramyl pentapeptide phosphotransferase [Desulfobacula sp.]
MGVIQIFYYLVCPIIFGAGGAWFVARYGFRLDIMDKANNRSSHSGSIPKGGGIGILATFIFVSVLLGFLYSFWIPAVFLSLASLLGDRVDLSVTLRLFIQIACAIFVLIYFFVLTGFNNYFLFPFMVLFIAGTSNIYNFMDGINGIAGITAVIAFGLLAFYAKSIGADEMYIVLSVSIALSSLSFLYFNIPVARVFMGDVGSVLLGFVFALIVIFIARDMTDFICMSGFLFLFYLDELTTMAERLKNGESLAKAHRKHFYQLLANEMGNAHWKISFGYGIFQLMIGLAIIFLQSYGIIFVFLLYAACSIGFIRVSNIIRKKV